MSWFVNGDNIQILPTNNSFEIYRYSDITFVKGSAKNHAKTLFYSKKPVKYTGDVDRRPKNNSNANNRTEENITKRLQKFTNIIKTKEIYRIPLRYLCGIGKVNNLIKIDLKTTCMFETDMNKLFESNRQLNSIVAFHDVAFIQYKQVRLNDNFRHYLKAIMASEKFLRMGIPKTHRQFNWLEKTIGWLA